jgi:hypothetical protein
MRLAAIHRGVTVSQTSKPNPENERAPDTHPARPPLQPIIYVCMYHRFRLLPGASACTRYTKGLRNYETCCAACGFIATFHQRIAFRTHTPPCSHAGATNGLRNYQICCAACGIIATFQQCIAFKTHTQPCWRHSYTIVPVHIESE